MNSNHKDPKVLIISHNSLSDTRNNGKTILSFFRGWDKEALAQIYKTNELPDTYKCDKFFFLPDIEVFKSFFNKKIVPGREVLRENKTSLYQENRMANKVKVLFRKRIPFLLLLQEFFWNSNWKKEELYRWINSFDPDVIFLQCSCPAIDKLAVNLSKEYGIPLFFEITDDYVSPKVTLDPFFWIYYGLICRYTKLAIQTSQKVLVIGHKMMKDYYRRFGGDYYVAMNAIDFSNPVRRRRSNDLFTIVYTGNLELNRWKVIYRIGKIIEKSCLKNRIVIKIFSGTSLSKRIERLFNECSSIVFCGKSDKNTTTIEQISADACLHVEDFSSKNKYITRYSISTKISEYMMANNCIIAVGPSDIASIEYISENDFGFVANSLQENEIVKLLCEVLEDEKARNEKSARAYKHAFKYHNQEVISDDIRNFIMNAIQFNEK